jgi:hypothetical protein
VDVAILGSAEFRVAQVDVQRLAFGPDGAGPIAGSSGEPFRSIEDVNGDGFTDLVVSFEVAETGILLGAEQACVTGETQDGTPFEDCGSIETSGGIDISPDRDLNFVNVMSPGLVVVALLADEDFDAADVDVTSLAFGPAGAAPALDPNDPSNADLSHRDVNQDGQLDLVSYYWIADTAIPLGAEEACLAGETLDGVAFEGCDAIITLSVACGLGFELVFVLPPLIWLYRRRRRARDSGPNTGLL